ncbi:MAG: OsmC family peroxiredoxin [Acidimicrobiia bacterium]|nr:OsmC family peroxiredoxin [Acidimicrobiia bacterium]
MPTRESSAKWSGPISSGSGTMSFGSGAYEGAYDVPSRFEDGEGTNPEELIGAAHAGCFSMQLSGNLTRAGFNVNSIDTKAAVSVEKADGGGWEITTIALTTTGDVDDIDEATFVEQANAAKEGCPVSKALTGVTITLEANLAG